MDIRRADEIQWSPPPRCPVCNVVVTACGKGEPFVVNGVGVYCRDHGPTAHPGYSNELSRYQQWREAVAVYRAWSDEAASNG